MMPRVAGALGCAFLVFVSIRQLTAADAQEVERTHRLALEGDAGAQVAYGILHETGEGVEQNATEASKWYRQAAELGHADGAFRLGWLYARGEGLPANLPQAVHWYEIAANGGHGVAQLSLGWLYLNGEGMPRDVPRAITWFQRAADQGDMNAYYTLGLIFSGAYEGVERDAATAAGWFQRAANRGLVSAQARLGAMFASGDGVVADDAEAYFWLNLALPNLSAGGFKDEIATLRSLVAARLSTHACATIEQRAAAWHPDRSGK